MAGVDSGCVANGQASVKLLGLPPLRFGISQIESDQVGSGLRPRSAELRFVVERKLQKRVAAVKVEFSRDVSTVVVDRAGTDKQLGGNLLACFIVSN